MVKKILIYILFLSFISTAAFAAGPIWPGLYVHGGDWSIGDAPGAGASVVCVVDDLTATGSGHGDGNNTNYNGTGQTVYEGDLQYCTELDSGTNGKYILAAKSGVIYDENGDLMYLEKCDWTIIDFDPPGLGGDGVLIKNIKLGAFDTDPTDETLTHLYIRDLRSFHGSGRNLASGSPENDTTLGQSNRKPMTIGTNSDQTIEDIVLHKSTFLWGLDGPLGMGGYNADAKRFTIADSIVSLAIAYDALATEYSSGTTYDKWARIWTSSDSNDNYYESVIDNNTGNAISIGSTNSYWRIIEYDMTDQSSDSWKGLTTGAIDGFSVIRNIFAHNGQRNPLLSNISTGNIDNNIIYNARSIGTMITSYGGGEEDYQKLSLSGNLGIGGPNSSSSTDTKFPTFWVYKAGWYYSGEPLESNTSNTSSSSTTLCDTSKNWSNDQWNGYSIRLVNGTGSGTMSDYGYITATNGTTECVTISSPWTTNPDSGTDYEIVDLSDHDIYIYDNTAIEYGDDCTPKTNSGCRNQDSLSNTYDWDYVYDPSEVPYQTVKHTSVPTGAEPSNYTPLDDDAVESALLAQDGSGAGAYNDNQDVVTAAIFSDVINRTNSALASYGTYKPEYILDSYYPTITTSSVVTLDIPEDMLDDCGNGYTRIEEWLHTGNIDACGIPDPPGDPPGNSISMKYNADAPSGVYNSNGLELVSP